MVAYLCFIKVCFRAYVSLFGFGICSFVSSFSRLSVCLNVLGETAVSLSLKGVCFIRYDPCGLEAQSPLATRKPGAHRLSLMWTMHALQLWWDLRCFVGRVESGALVRPGFDVRNLFWIFISYCGIFRCYCLFLNV